MPYQESWGSQDPIEQSNTLSQAGITCSKTGFTIHKLDRFISWHSFYASHNMRRFLSHTDYTLNSSQLAFLRWYHMVYVDDTPRLYATIGETYIELIGDRARKMFNKLVGIQGSCIDQQLSLSFDNYWAIWGNFDRADFYMYRENHKIEIVYCKNKPPQGRKRGKRGGKKHKK